MLRRFHSILGLSATVLVVVLALSGSYLGFHAAVDALPLPADLSLRDVLEAVARQNTGLEITDLRRDDDGRLILSYVAENMRQIGVLDPMSGGVESLAPRSTFYSVIEDLHRSFMLGQTGRGIAGAVAAVMTILSVSGLWLLMRRQGGLRGLLAPVRGRWPERLHTHLGRSLVLPLVLSSLTGVLICLDSFDLLPKTPRIVLPESSGTGVMIAPQDIPGLDAIALKEFRRYLPPIPGDDWDVHAVTTVAGIMVFDQFSGADLAFIPAKPSSILLEWASLLHTGRGLGWLAFALAMMGVSVPVFAVTGAAIARRRWIGGTGRIAHNVPAAMADTVILVGSEGGTTWAYARALHATLTAAGQSVHTASLNETRARYPEMRTLLILAATYGDGAAPQNAARFLGGLPSIDWPKAARFAVLSFGDANFPRFGAFGDSINAALEIKGLTCLMPLTRVDRHALQTVEVWQCGLACALGVALPFTYTPPTPPTRTLALVRRKSHAMSEAYRTDILTFRPVKGRFARHKAGDLLAIYAQGAAPRLYSLASCGQGEQVEICVRRHPNGQCSPFLCDMPNGTTIEARLLRNPGFHAPRYRSAVLIGAGTGIAPLAGMVRSARSNRGHLMYFGGRDPQLDALYGFEMVSALTDRRLSLFRQAWSRTDTRTYVQDLVREDASHIAGRIRRGAVVMVCGGPDMAAAVRREIDLALTPFDLSVASLRASGRYREDTY